MKKRKIFLCVVSASVLINVIPLLPFMDRIAVSNYAWFAVILMMGVSLNGVISFFLRRKGNFLPIGARTPMSRYFSEDKAHTFTEEYEKEFFWQFCLYWFAIPFYIPCIFFVSGAPECFLLPICVFLVPQLFYFICYILNIIKGNKEYQIKKQKQEQELKEQNLQEELGRFK